MNVKIKRSKWMRGRDEALLFDVDTGEMCCLGFVSRKCGAKKSDIAGVTCPNDVLRAHVAARLKSIGLVSPVNTNTEACKTLMEINDNDSISDKKREKLLKHEAEKIGIKFKFVD